jgi:hypothetical protein
MAAGYTLSVGPSTRGAESGYANQVPGPYLPRSGVLARHPDETVPRKGYEHHAMSRVRGDIIRDPTAGGRRRHLPSMQDGVVRSKRIGDGRENAASHRWGFRLC